jgi:hypothetical protein
MGTVLHDRLDYVARARSLGPVLAAAADEIERNRESPQAVVTALINNGLFRLLQPRSLGGAELDPMTYMQVVEQLASLYASTGWCVEQANGCSMAAAFLDPEIAQEIFGSPDGIIAWGRVGRAVRRPWRVPPDRCMELRQRQPSCQLARRSYRGARSRRRATVPRGRRRNSPYLAVSKESRHDDLYLARGQSARHRQRPVFGDRCVHFRTSYRVA